jgi:hypothetical protein
MRRLANQQGQITLRSVDQRLAEEIRKVAREEGISLNKATLKLLRRGAGLQAGRVLGPFKKAGATMKAVKAYARRTRRTVRR